jgi:hypothetical protein
MQAPVGKTTVSEEERKILTRRCKISAEKEEISA